jgi:hypothetical protein
MSTTVTTLNEVKKQSDQTGSLPSVPAGFGDSRGFELMQRGAKLLASSTLVPKEYQGNIPNCVIALNMANRIGADPLMVMQNLYVVHGRPSWSSQFLVATFNMCGRFSALRYEFFGEKGKPSWGCRAWSIERDTGQKLVGADIDIALAKAEGWESKNGSKWKTMPQQMLMYRAASFFIRAYAPELSMGLYTREEIEDHVDLEKSQNGVYSATTDGLKEKLEAAGKMGTGPEVGPGRAKWEAAAMMEPELAAEVLGALTPESDDQWGALAETLTTKIDDQNAEAI